MRPPRTTMQPLVGMTPVTPHVAPVPAPVTTEDAPAEVAEGTIPPATRSLPTLREKP